MSMAPDRTVTMGEHLYLQRIHPQDMEFPFRRNLVHDPACRSMGEVAGWAASPIGYDEFSFFPFTEGYPDGPLEDTMRFQIRPGGSTSGTVRIHGPFWDWDAIDGSTGRVYVLLRARATGDLIGRSLTHEISSTLTQLAGQSMTLWEDWDWRIYSFIPSGPVDSSYRLRIQIGENYSPPVTSEIQISHWAILTQPGGGMPSGIGGADAAATYFDGTTYATGTNIATAWDGLPDHSPSALYDVVPSAYSAPIKRIAINRGGQIGAATLEPQVGTAQVTTAELPPGGYNFGETYAIKTMPAGFPGPVVATNHHPPLGSAIQHLDIRNGTPFTYGEGFINLRRSGTGVQMWMRQRAGVRTQVQPGDLVRALVSVSSRTAPTWPAQVWIRFHVNHQDGSESRWVSPRWDLTNEDREIMATLRVPEGGTDVGMEWMTDLGPESDGAEVNFWDAAVFVNDTTTPFFDANTDQFDPDPGYLYEWVSAAGVSGSEKIRKLYSVPGANGDHLFTGQLADIASNTVLDPTTGETTVESDLYFVDIHRDIANTKRYGLVTPGDNDQATVDRVHQLMESAPHVRYYARVADASWLHQSVVYESSLANHLTLTAVGGNAAWCIDRDNRMRFTSGLVSLTQVPLTTWVNLTDGTADPGPDFEPWAYVGYTSSWHSKQAITRIDLTNHGRMPNPDDPFAWVADDRSFVRTDDDAVDQWGLRSAELDSCVIHSQGSAVAHHYAGLREPANRPRTVRLNAGLYGFPAGLDIMDVLTVTRNGEHYRCYVAAISHTITPTSWIVEYRLGDTGIPPVVSPDAQHLAQVATEVTPEQLAAAGEE